MQELDDLDCVKRVQLLCFVNADTFLWAYERVRPEV
jgi:hypothetical protein